jgi:hypothetical protein
MASKRSTKLNKCKHVFVNGAKKGKKCNKNCYGDYCKEHNKNKKNYQKKYQKKYYDENIRKPDEYYLNKKIEKIEAITDLRNITRGTIAREHNKLFNDYRLKKENKLKEAYGLIIFLGLKKEADIYRPYVQKLYNNDVIDKDLYDYAMSDDDINNWDLRIRNMMDRKKFFVPYKGTKKEAKKRHAQILEEINKLQNFKINQTKIIEAYEKRRRELLDKKFKNKQEQEESEEESEEEVQRSKESEESKSEESEEKNKYESYDEKCTELTNYYDHIRRQNYNMSDDTITEHQKNTLIMACENLINECEQCIDEWKKIKDKKIKELFVENVKALMENAKESLKSYKRIKTLEDEHPDDENEEYESMFEKESEEEKEVVEI